MGVCRKGAYRDNVIIKHGPPVCFGGFGEAPCEYLQDCRKENGLKERRRPLKRGRNGSYW